LVLAGLSRGQAGGLLEIGIEIVALAGFTALVGQAARVVGPELLPGFAHGRWLLGLAVVGAAGTQLLVPRLVESQEPSARLCLLAGLLPAACHGGAVGTVLVGGSRAGTLRDRQANTLFTFLGIASFALTVALGFLIYWSDDPVAALHRLSIVLALAGIPVL